MGEGSVLFWPEMKEICLLLFCCCVFGQSRIPVPIVFICIVHCSKLGPPLLLFIGVCSYTRIQKSQAVAICKSMFSSSLPKLLFITWYIGEVTSSWI